MIHPVELTATGELTINPVVIHSAVLEGLAKRGLFRGAMGKGEMFEWETAPDTNSSYYGAVIPPLTWDGPSLPMTAYRS